MGRTRRTELSPQQMMVLKHASDGLGIKETAACMGLSPSTVKNYRAAVYLKMGCRNVQDLLMRAVKKGYLTGNSNIHVEGRP